MAWGYFSYFGLGKVVFIEGKMNAELYVNILFNNLPDLARLMGQQNYIFQQDNNP
ncbi:transposase [Vairimorpha ceranae]|uniref:Transposase n=1 Tax=Vairimorpha ceranae TaxID=40302 RepID=A0A0F9WAF5_9MICR|nr:transposase [Vairimorpha ceranae]KKO73910.1 transposase [Vairimorpha ceranae]